MRIVIIDYGMGNVKSVYNALHFLGYEAEIISDPEALKSADVVVFPGVGAFGEGMLELEKRSLIEPIKEHISKGKPFLGLCLGLHLLFDKSYEHGEHKGLGILQGEVLKFPDPSETGLKVPQMGWNTIKIFKQHDIFKDFPSDSYVYFVHSYYVQPEDENIVAGKTDYGVEYCSMVIKDNIFAMQFHPEKSQKLGLKLLENFLNNIIL